MAKTIVVETTNDRTYPLHADQLYVMVSDFQGHHQRIIPSVIARSSYRATGGPDLNSVVIEGMRMASADGRPFRLEVHEIEPGRAFRMEEQVPPRWIEYRVIPVSASESRLEITMGSILPGTLRAWPQRILTRSHANRVSREVLDNIEVYRQTLGSTVLATTDSVTADSDSDRD